MFALTVYSVVPLFYLGMPVVAAECGIGRRMIGAPCGARQPLSGPLHKPSPCATAMRRQDDSLRQAWAVRRASSADINRRLRTTSGFDDYNIKAESIGTVCRFQRLRSLAAACGIGQACRPGGLRQGAGRARTCRLWAPAPAGYVGDGEEMSTARACLPPSPHSAAQRVNCMRAGSVAWRRLCPTRVLASLEPPSGRCRNRRRPAAEWPPAAGRATMATLRVSSG